MSPLVAFIVTARVTVEEEGRNEGHLTPQDIARLVGEGIAAARQGQPQEQQVNTSRLKMKSPDNFDGKSCTNFNQWWESVVMYLRFYPETVDRQKIAWVGTLLTDTALSWYLQRYRELNDADIWVNYSASLRAAYHNDREAADAQLVLGQLKYHGCIRTYLTEFRALNNYARATGEALREKVDLAISDSILDMRFNQNPEDPVDDEHFLQATQRAGLQVEKKKALKAAKEAMRSQASGGSGVGGKDGQSGKGSGNTRKGKEQEGPKQTGKSDSGVKAEKPRKPWTESRWGSIVKALKGVPQNEIDSHKAGKANCWRCGRDTHSTSKCYACTMAKGTELPEAPKVTSAVQGKRKREREEPAEAPAQKKPQTVTIKTEDDNMREAASAWMANRKNSSVWDNDDSDF